MPTDPIQQAAVLMQLSLLLIGTLLILKLVLNPTARSQWLGTNRLPPWPVSGAEFLLFVVLLLVCGFLFPSAARILFGEMVARAVDRSGLEVLVYGAGFHGGALVGWLLFPHLCRSWLVDGGALPTRPPPLPTAPALGWARVFFLGAGTIFAALPIVAFLSVGWLFLLRKLGLPDEQQDLIAVFANTRSPLVVAGMLLVACVVAPLNEELIFRAGIYRFCRPRLGRSVALVISGCLFGAMHVNLAGFVPLATLGAMLALAYEATGDIRVTVIAHGLFNLTTIIVVLSGLPDGT